jgi:hypothetical protein
MSNETTTIRMKDFGSTLGTRVLGARVREHILSALRSSSAQIVLDFDGVSVMTQSFGDELFRKLVETGTPDEVSRVKVGRMSDDVRAVFRYSLSRGEPTPQKS